MIVLTKIKYSLSNMFNNIKSKSNTYCLLIWIFFSVLLGIFNSIYSNTLTYDDVNNSYGFDSLIEKRGIIEIIILLFFNFDLGNEFRTYGLSRVIHFIIHLLAGSNAAFYQFLITTTHCLSAILVYKILVLLKVDIKSVLFSCLFYAISPFTFTQTFHHFSYIFLPFYFFLLYILFELKHQEFQEKKSIKNCLLNNIYSIILILCTLFTGENTLSLLGIAMFILFCVGFIKKHKNLIFRYAFHMVIFISSFIIYRFIWMRYHQISSSDYQRFSFTGFNPNAIIYFFNAFIENLKYFLFINENKLYINPNYLWKLPLCFAIIFLFISLIILLIFSKKKYFRDISIKTPITTIFILFICLIS